MSENVEDLYLKGFMAYSGKDLKAAQAFYEQVLAIDPSHQRAKEGLQQVLGAGGGGAQATRKRSSKEILAEIKQLYSDKRYEDSLSLCLKLLAKHPDNKDLQGLKERIENKCRPQRSPSPTPAEKSTQQFAMDAETAVSDDDALSNAAQVEKLIHRGVSLYEIQDYENAIAAWKQVLELDPNNRIARDYITNVQPLLGNDQEDDYAAPGDRKPTKEEMVTIYNEAMALYKDERYSEAIERWNHILKFHPTHKETLHCVEKARAAMGKNAADEEATAEAADHHTAMLEEAREELTHGRQLEAERIITRLSIEAPNLPGLDALRTALEERQRQITEIRSLEIEAEEEEDDTTASDDEITRYFTPETSKAQEARQVSRVERPKESASSGSKLWMLVAVVVLAGLGVGGWYGYKYYVTMQAMNATNIELPVDRQAQENWNGTQSIAEDFLIFAHDFRDEGQPLLAAYAYARVIDVVKPRLNELTSSSTKLTVYEETVEKVHLNDMLLEAQAEHTKALAAIVKIETDPNSLDLADAEIRRGRFQDACERMFNTLSGDLDNTQVRDKLGNTLEAMALDLVAENKLEDARMVFRKVTTLKSAFEISRRHEEVIQRYFQSRITSDEKDQWFFFYTK